MYKQAKFMPTRNRFFFDLGSVPKHFFFLFKMSLCSCSDDTTELSNVVAIYSVSLSSPAPYLLPRLMINKCNTLAMYL